MTVFDIVTVLAGFGLTLLTTWLRERYRHGRVLKVSRQLPAGSVYIDDSTGVRIRVGSCEAVELAAPNEDGSL